MLTGTGGAYASRRPISSIEAHADPDAVKAEKQAKALRVAEDRVRRLREEGL